jgi:hypothetical protein
MRTRWMQKFAFVLTAAMAASFTAALAFGSLPAGASPLTAGAISLSSHVEGAASTYTVGFTTSSSGALAANSGTITLFSPPGTVFPLVAGNYTVAVNGGSATPVTATPSGSNTAVTITTPVAVGNSTSLVVVATGVTNPTV